MAEAGNTEILFTIRDKEFQNSHDGSIMNISLTNKKGFNYCKSLKSPDEYF